MTNRFVGLTILSLLLIAMSYSHDAEARGRKGSHRVGGTNSHGKGSHYVGGHSASGPKRPRGHK